MAKLFPSLSSKYWNSPLSPSGRTSLAFFPPFCSIACSALAGIPQTTGRTTHLHGLANVLHVEVELRGAGAGGDVIRLAHGAADGEHAARHGEGQKLVRGETQRGRRKGPVEDGLVEGGSCLCQIAAFCRINAWRRV